MEEIKGLSGADKVNSGSPATMADIIEAKEWLAQCVLDMGAKKNLTAAQKMLVLAEELGRQANMAVLEEMKADPDSR